MKNFVSILIATMIGTIAVAQQKNITGTVSDDSGHPLPGATVIVKGTSNGTTTDFDGNYSITANFGEILVFAYVGYDSQEVTIGVANVINVSMQSSSELDEVVVVGYGVSRSRAVSGYYVARNHKPSKAQLKRQEQKAYHSTLANQLKGKVSGVSISNNNGVTGSGTNVLIRGQHAIKPGKEPLYIVDGVPIQKLYNGIVAGIDPNEIEKMNVYKGADARSRFGKIAKHGCIVITTRAGNYRIENDESYSQINENDFERVSLSPLSTFSIDVDKASYSNIRRMINNGQQIFPDAVKIEEMINYFDYSYPQPTDEHPFSINTEVGITPWNQDTKLVRIGLQGKEYESKAIPSTNLTFLIDVSGSMSAANKLPLLKSAFRLLVNQLRAEDKVSIVVYAGAAGVVLKPTSGDKKEEILAALNNLEAGGSTAGGAGIKLAYRLAEKNFKKWGNNRVILATDGDFNVGASSDKAMEELIEEKRESGVFLSVLGFGMGNYKDSKLETLADKGNGNHAYIDTMLEAQKVFGAEFGGTLYTIAKDVKIQVEFNPTKVQAYRLIGYENRLLADEDFKDDTKDAGELGSGHKVTALYEVIPAGVSSEYLKSVDELKYTQAIQNDANSDELFTVKFRYKKPDGTKSIEMVHVQKDEIASISSDFKFASAVALLGMRLRKSKYDNGATLNDIIALAKSGRGKDRKGYRAEFIRLIKTIE
ncbi:von Willebrand factor type A domain-containing protein [Sungkyunkwania multivorans]|uniref:von Willebrand factor type A domain-containing protein n=1 Tax=Sungkyunkwania multivorans TaxID=1173618 RepID=A0ABW3CY14_9FLAO